MLEAPIPPHPIKPITSLSFADGFFGEAKVNGQTVAEAEISAMLADTADAKAFASKHG